MSVTHKDADLGAAFRLGYTEAIVKVAEWFASCYAEGSLMERLEEMRAKSKDAAWAFIKELQEERAKNKEDLE